MYLADSKLIPAAILALGCGLFSATAAGQDDGASAAADSAEADSPAPWQLEQDRAVAALIEQIPATELNWLAVDGRQALSLYRPSLTAEPKKMVLISLSNSSAELLQANIMHELYRTLPDHGWPTLQLLLPPYLPADPVSGEQPITPSAANENNNTNDAEPDDGDNTGDETNSEPDTAGAAPDANDARETIAAARLAAAIGFAIEQESIAVTLLADRETAAPAIAASIDQGEKVSGLVLWQVETDKLDIAALTQLAESRTTVLDIIDEPLGMRARNERRRVFALAGVTDDYQLIVAPAEPASHAIKRIRSWLARSFEVD